LFAVMSDYQVIAVAGTELSEIQRQIDNLPVKTDAESVGQLLSMRRDVLFLEFDVTVRHSVRDTFLARGNIPAYKVIYRRPLVWSFCCLHLSSFTTLHIVFVVANSVCITNK